jgi:hypothetical protein
MQALQKAADAAPPADVFAPGDDPLMRLIERAVMTPDFDVLKLQSLFEIKERWEANQARKAFEVAITEAKAELPAITRNKAVSFGKDKGTAYRHETLDHIVETIQPVLEKHGLSFRYRSDFQDGKVIVTCRIAHRDGYSEETSLPSTPGRKTTSRRSAPLSHTSSDTLSNWH